VLIKLVVGSKGKKASIQKREKVRVNYYFEVTREEGNQRQRGEKDDDSLNNRRARVEEKHSNNKVIIPTKDDCVIQV
jgi:hypothetical protein